MPEPASQTDGASVQENGVTEADAGPAETDSEVIETTDEIETAESEEPFDIVPVIYKGGCSGCHVIPDVPGAIGQTGPDLSNIGVDGATRIEGYDAAEYIRESILSPDAFIASECPAGECPAGIMLQNFADTLSDEELDGIVSYLSGLGVDSSLADASEEAASSEEAEQASSEGVPSSKAVEPSAETEEQATPTDEEPVEETLTTEDTAEVAIDMDAVAAIVTKGTCGACHVIPDVPGAVGVLGPDLANIGAESATRIDGYTAEEYLRESILEPNAFIAPKCPAGDCLPGVMLPNLADLLTSEEIDTLIGYLLTLKGEAQ